MNTTTRYFGRRLGTLGLALLLALAFAGDRGRAATVPAAIYGQDPLEILELKVRPNVVIVLDSSGSMKWTTAGAEDPHRGDHPRSKMRQAKNVLNQVIAANQDKVNFMMSQYYQVDSGFHFVEAAAAGVRRFQYTATAAAPILRARGDTSDRGFQSWQDIRATFNRIHYREDTGGSPAVCYGDVPAQFYQTGLDLAAALRTAMNNATCSPARAATQNTYTVGYNPNGTFAFSSNLQRSFEMLWSTSTNSIRGALAVTWGDTVAPPSGTTYSGRPYVLLSTSEFWPGIYGPMEMTGSFTDGTPPVTYYQVGAARLWNGETLQVQSDGTICGLVPATTLHSPAEFFVQLVNTNCVAFAPAPTPVAYRFSGAMMTFNGDDCGGFEKNVDLVPCDLGNTPSQVSLIGKYLDLEFPFNSDGTPEFYSEATTTGTWAALTWPAADNAATPLVDEAQGGIRAAGGTPMANSLIDIKVWFDNVWTNGQVGATTQAGGLPIGPWQITPIKDHVSPKEKTIVLLVTDGDDTCATRDGDGSTDSASNALRTAHKAQMLYDGVGAPADPASKVQTYVIGYGSGAKPDKMNWIAWGGSGLRAGTSNPGTTGTGEDTRWTSDAVDTAQSDASFASQPGVPALITNALQPARRACKTCQDAKIATDAAALAAVLQGIINQGAQEGEFIAGRSITETVFEYADLAGAAFRSDDPTPAQGSTGRYAGIVPTRFVSSFSLPGFNGQLKAYQNDGAENSVLRWAAGDKLLWRVRYGTANPPLDTSVTPAVPLTSYCSGGTCSCGFNPALGIAAEECTFADLTGIWQGTSAADETSALSSAKIKRRIYTTVGNGVYPSSTSGLAQALVSGIATKRVRLWPPQSGLLPADYTSAADLPGGAPGSLDLALGLPVPSTGTLQVTLIVTSQIGSSTGGAVTHSGTPYPIQVGDICVVANATKKNGNPNKGDWSLWNGTWTVRATPAPTATTFTLNGPTAPVGTVPSGYGGTITCTVATPPPGAATDLAKLQTDYKACKGSNLPTQCTDTSNVFGQLEAARREAREIILAYMAGAAPVPDGEGWKRTTDIATKALLFKAKTWVLADSISTAAVLTYPVEKSPAIYSDQYTKYAYGVGLDDSRGIAQSKAGFGLRTPDDLVSGPRTKLNLKPVMTVVIVPSNDMLHAFRAGPTFAPSNTAANNRGCPVPLAGTAPSALCEYGGEELWGFVPYDQLLGLGLRTKTEAAGTEASKRDDHVYMMAGSIRFSDVFVPGTASFEGYSTAVGVWRRVMFIGRGIGGKYLTALDVTGTGPYTIKAEETGGPIPLWTRGNPDVLYGSLGGTDNSTTTDKTAYAKMGETWSVPVVAHVNRGTAQGGVYTTTRRPSPNGPEFVLFVGSGYGLDSGCASNTNPCEGRTFFTLDALSGDVIAAVDVGARAGMSFSNAIVANPAGFNPGTYQPLVSVHPSVSDLKRVYVGDVHGRLWKFLTADPTKAIPFADLGAEQPIGTAVSLIGIGSDPDHPDDNLTPYVFATSGADRRVEGPFKIYGFRDDGTDSNTNPPTGTTTGSDGQTVAYTPVANLFVRPFDQGAPEANCGNTTTDAVFRGTVQPATTFECASVSNGVCTGRKARTFFGGTRLSLPNTTFAPPTPLACGNAGEYPCRSQFDSILYALISTTGGDAYDLNSSGDDAYRVLRDSRLSAVSMFADPNISRGGSRLNLDEGRLRGVPKPPPPPGVPPTAQSASASVFMKREPGEPPPAVRYGSTVCQ